MVGKIDMIDEPKSLAGCIWMLGEYSEKIKNNTKIIEGICDKFKEHPKCV